MLSACVVAGIGVSLLGTDWWINPIVLRVEWWFDGKHFFIPKPHEVKLYLLQQLLAASQTGNEIGFRQLLCATSFDAVELEIMINYFVYSQSVNASFACISHDSVDAILDCLPGWAQGLRHSQCSRWHTQNAVCRCPVANQSHTRSSDFL